MVAIGKVNGVPRVTPSELALVMVGAWSTVSVNVWVTVPAGLVAVMASAKVPVAVGVPAMMAVPLAPAAKVAPAGRAPVSVRVGAGVPVVLTGKLKASPAVAVYEPALVMAGAWSTVSVKVWVTVPAVLVAVTMNVEVPTVVGVPERVAAPLAPAT